MRQLHRAVVLACAVIVAGCEEPGVATSYHQQLVDRYGYSQKEVKPGIWTVVFIATGDTDWDTAKTYWFYRCAELTLERQFDGFRVVDPQKNSQTDVPAMDRLFKVDESAPASLYLPASAERANTLVYKADLKYFGTIQLLKKPLPVEPGRVFDAAKVKAALDPYVHGTKCDHGNVCPHEPVS